MLEDYRENKPVLETERLILRSLCAEDADDLREWLGLEEVYTYWGRKVTLGEKEPERMFVEKRPWVKRKPTLDFKWGIVLKETGKVIGEIFVEDIVNCRMGKNVGYRIHPAYWNQKITTEALSAVVDFVFHHTELDRLQATVDIRNVGSYRVLEKCGFVREGMIRHGKMVSEYCDYYIYGMLAEDYGYWK